MTTGTRLRLPDALDPPGVPTVELAARTRREEARAAMALVAGVHGAGVPIRDVAVVARDLTPYEAPLEWAAREHALTPTFWTQLYVTRTRPFALLASVCTALDAETLDAETLLRPLEHRWAPPDAADATDATGTFEATDASSAEWPFDPTAVSALARQLPDGARTLTEWAAVLAGTSDVDARVATYVAWLRGRPEPTPADAGPLVEALVDAYEAVGLPATAASDGPDRVETEADARAVVRLRELADRIGPKYRDGLADGTRTASWGDVADLARLVVEQRPGRREHSNARAVDVFEANDVWALDVPYVVVVGLVDGEWPGTTASPLPVELREAVLAGEGDASALVPRTPWTTGRDADHFADALAAATRGLVLTRHAETTDGIERHPSPFLDALDPTPVPASGTRALLSADGTLPAAVRAFVEAGDDVR